MLIHEALTDWVLPLVCLALAPLLLIAAVTTVEWAVRKLIAARRGSTPMRWREVWEDSSDHAGF